MFAFISLFFFYCIKKWSSREEEKNFMTERKISGNAVKTKFINYVFALHKIAMEGPTKQDTKKTKERRSDVMKFYARAYYEFSFLSYCKSLNCIFFLSKDNCTAVVIRSSSAWGYSACLFFCCSYLLLLLGNF